MLFRKSETVLNITALLNADWVGRIRRMAFCLGILVVVIGILVLIGSYFDISLLTSGSPDWVSTRPIVAVALVLAGISLLFQLHVNEEPVRRRIAIGKVLGTAVSVLGVYDLMRGYEGVAPLTSITLILVGFALVTLPDRPGVKHPVSHPIAFVILAFSLLPAIGYLYGTPFRFELGLYCDMAVPTAICCIAIGVAVLFARLNHDLAAVVVSDGPGGFMARRLIPMAVLGLIFLGWLRVAGERHHLFSDVFGTALFTTAAIAAAVGIIWRQSLVLQKAEIGRRLIADERESLRIEGQMRDQFVSMLSHDLRTPLTAASAQAQYIAARAKDVEMCKRGAVNITRSLGRADDLIRDLLDASRVQAGHKLPITLERGDLAETLEAVLDELTLIHGDRFIAHWERPMWGDWDRKALGRVVQNLCSNAIKYGAPDNPVTVTAEMAEDMLIIAVHNEGNEITSEEQGRLFDLFQRSSKHEMSHKPGWGIGLALVRAIVEAHGGRVRVESRRGSGTTFTVSLPKNARLSVQQSARA